MPANIHDLVKAVQNADEGTVRRLLHERPELVGHDLAENNEHRAIHFAVLQRNSAMVQLLMEAGSDAHKGIYPHRDATSASMIAKDREYSEILRIIEKEEQARREELSCPNATVSAVQDQIDAAIEDGEDDIAIRLLQTDATLIHACNRAGGTPLHVSAENGNLEMMEWLLKRRAKVDKQDMAGHTPLDCAAWEMEDGFPAMSRLLLEHGAELTIAGAVALGDARKVRELLAAKSVELSRIGKRGGLLTLAVQHGQLAMIQLLLDLGADVDERITFLELETPTVSWGMPLWHAALKNQHEISKLLLERGADPNANVYASGWPLRNAWNHADGVIKKMLLVRGAKMQPYMVSEMHDVDEARRLLAVEQSEELAQELAWSAADSGCAAIVEMAIPHIKWPLNDSRWHWVLIQPIRGATADRENTAGHFDSMSILLRHGVDPDVSRYGATALHFAAAYRGQVSEADRARFTAMLLDAGASFRVRDELLMSTPLGWTMRWRRAAMAEVLLSRGATMDEPEAEPWAAPSAWQRKYPS